MDLLPCITVFSGDNIVENQKNNTKILMTVVESPIVFSSSFCDETSEDIGNDFCWPLSPKKEKHGFYRFSSFQCRFCRLLTSCLVFYLHLSSIIVISEIITTTLTSIFVLESDTQKSTVIGTSWKRLSLLWRSRSGSTLSVWREIRRTICVNIWVYNIYSSDPWYRV